MPKTVKDALLIDKQTNTNYWRNAIEKEMGTIEVAFEFLEPGQAVPIGYQKIPLHFVFDVKLDFTRKARLVVGGHMTDPPSSITYSSLVSRDSVCLALMIAALNDLDILAVDIGNAYLNAETREKVFAIAGPEFGSRKGYIVIIGRALYGLKSSGAAWWAHLAETLHTLGYTPSLANPDVWLRAAVKPNGEPYYEYVLVYVDDILSISVYPQGTMNALAKLYHLKDAPCKPAKYLGADIIEHYYPDTPTKRTWGMSSYQFVKEAIRVVELELGKVGKKLTTKASTPMYADYRPELDISLLLDAHQAKYYQELIGILRWAVELGRIDIHVQVAMLSSYTVQPRVGHLDAVFCIFAYLKANDRSKIVFDPTLPTIDERRFTKYSWEDFYRGVKEAIPPNMPQSRGKEVEIHCFR